MRMKYSSVGIRMLLEVIFLKYNLVVKIDRNEVILLSISKVSRPLVNNISVLAL